MSHSDHRSTACFEIRRGNLVLGPISIDEIRSGVADGTIPDWTPARRVTPWLPVQYVPTIIVAPRQDQHQCI